MKIKDIQNKYKNKNLEDVEELYSTHIQPLLEDDNTRDDQIEILSNVMTEINEADSGEDQDEMDPKNIWKTIAHSLIANTAKDFTLIAKIGVLDEGAIKNKQNISKLAINLEEPGKYSGTIKTHDND